MSFDTREISEYGGQPEELLLFTAGGTNYYYTTSDAPITFLGQVYDPGQSVEWSDRVASTQIEQNEITVRISPESSLAQLFVPMLPPVEMTLDIYRKHHGDADVDVKPWWSGIVVSSSFKGNWTELRCASWMALFFRVGVRRLFQPSCNHILYDPDTCGLDPNAYKSTVSVTDISTDGTVLSSSTFLTLGSNYLTGGFIKRVVNGDMRYIVGHTGDDITLWHPFEGMATFETAEVYAGCDHTDVTCLGKFNNLVNCGCWPTVPLINPASKKFA